MSTYYKKGSYIVRPRFKNTPEDVSDKGSSMARKAVSAQQREDSLTDKPLTREEYDAIRRGEEEANREELRRLRAVHAQHEVDVRNYEKLLRHAAESKQIIN